MANVSIKDLFYEKWKEETTWLCEHQTYRQTDGTPEELLQNRREVNGTLIQIRNYLKDKADAFSASLENAKFELFQWCRFDDKTTTTEPLDEDCLSSAYWVFGFRFGGSQDPKHKISMICHLDTVPADEDSEWKPFVIRPESREYEGGTTSPQDFLVGRGCIDDKGPAASAFLVARALALKYDKSPLLQHTQIEIIFDTSEETDMSTPKYLEDTEKTTAPDFGVVYDAQWCVRAEKGCERPVFTVSPTAAPTGTLYVSRLETAPGNSTNTIPDYAEAVITGDGALVEEFAKSVEKMYEVAVFDDAGYTKAALTVASDSTSVTLKTAVAGAQHGSAPDENRRDGANPLVSLANFIASLVKDGTIGINAEATLCEFIRYVWGTKVFGEGWDSLYKHDEVFTEGNGTSYAVTKVSTDEKTNKRKLEIDVRYAMDHHCSEWDGYTEGLLEGDESTFKDDLGSIVNSFNSSHAEYPEVEFEGRTMFGPDIRVPDTNEDYMTVEAAFEGVMGYTPPRLAIGGGTDAKGYTFLLGVGPLFGTNLGPPINYHGIDEGAPMVDVCKSTEILFSLFSKEIESPVARNKSKAMKALKRVEEISKRGHKFCCNC